MSAYAFSAPLCISSAETAMRWCRSTPTTPACVVSTLWHPALTAAAVAMAMKYLRLITAPNELAMSCVDKSKPRSFQGIGKKESRDAEQRRNREGDAGTRGFPRPAGEQRPGCTARAIGKPGKQRLPARVRASGEHPLHGGDGRGVECAERCAVQQLREHQDPQHRGGPADGEEA